MDVIEMIPSKDMRQALRESGREFTDMEKATIIHNLERSPRRRRELLEELAGETGDAILREQIRWSLDEEQSEVDWFRNVDEGYVFGVHVNSEDEDDWPEECVDAYFAGYATAYEYGCSATAPFSIRKWLAWETVPDRECFDDGSRGLLRFDAEGDLTYASVWGVRDEDPQFYPNITEGKWPWKQHFQGRWLDLPNLYKQGDIVRVCGSIADYIGARSDLAVVDVDAKLWEKDRRRASELQRREEDGEEDVACPFDYSDMQITVFFPCKDGTFAHDHINPMFLERPDAKPEDDEAELLNVLQGLCCENYYIEELSRVLKRHVLAGAKIQ